MMYKYDDKNEKLDEIYDKVADDPSNKGISLAELMKQPEIHENYLKNRSVLPMEDLVDRIIKIHGYTIAKRPNYKGEVVDMVTLQYTLEDDDTERETTTQAKAILEVMGAVPKELFDDGGYVTAMIQMRKLPNGGRAYSFVL